MSSFQKLWENIQIQKESSSKEDKAVSVIRTGIGIRDQFWDDFLQVINNSDGISELLGVPITQISGWHSKIKQALDKVKEADSSPELQDKGKLLKTGHNEEPDPHTVVMNQI